MHACIRMYAHHHKIANSVETKLEAQSDLDQVEDPGEGTGPSLSNGGS